MLIVIINALLINLNYICELINGASDSQQKKKIKGASNQLVKVVLHLMSPNCLFVWSMTKHKSYSSSTTNMKLILIWWFCFLNNMHTAKLFRKYLLVLFRSLWFKLIFNYRMFGQKKKTDFFKSGLIKMVEYTKLKFINVKKVHRKEHFIVNHILLLFLNLICWESS